MDKYKRRKDIEMRPYCATDQRIHLLAQIIAKINRTYVPAKADDSHTNLYYEPITRRLYGRWFEAHERFCVFTLHLSEFQFQLINNRYEAALHFDIAGKTIAQLEYQIAEAFVDIGLETNGLFDPIHYEIENYDFANDPVRTISLDNLEEWCLYRTQANHMCTDFLGFTQHIQEVRIWPHHFDTGVYVQANENMGVGFGLAMNDQIVDQPYYYMSAYPKDGKMDYRHIPESPYWRMEIKENWAGCILPLDSIQNKEERVRRPILLDYLNLYRWMFQQ